MTEQERIRNGYDWTWIILIGIVIGLIRLFHWFAQIEMI